MLGENGIIRKAQQASGIWEEAKVNEQSGLDILDGHIANYINENGGGENPEPPPEPEEYLDSTLAIAPKVAEGMTRVKYNSTNQTWERVTAPEAEWYNYGSKQWANVVLGDATFDANGVLNESLPYTQLVWIPRYAYKITSMYHQNGAATTAGNIEVVFIDTANQDKAKTTTYTTTYPGGTVGGSMADFVVHPAFEYGGQHLAGIWVGKFESSHTGCNTTKSTGEVADIGNEVITVRANVTSWRNLTIGNMFAKCLEMNNANNPYGLNTNDNVVDPHLLKNDEWGAVAYLSKSAYGKQNEEVFINNNSNCITGIAGGTASATQSTATTNSYKTTNGVKASTNGNATGIYDMSGGAWEYTAAYVDNGNGSLTTNGGNLVVAGTASKYRNVYTQGSSNTNANNYAVSTPANGKYGDAGYETSNSGNSPSGGWYEDYSYFASSSGPFFGRGGSHLSTIYAGMFTFDGHSGAASTDNSFRVSLPVL